MNHRAQRGGQSELKMKDTKETTVILTFDELQLIENALRSYREAADIMNNKTKAKEVEKLRRQISVLLPD